MGGSSQGIGETFASDLLVRAPWLTPFLGTAGHHRTGGRRRPFVSWVTARVHEEQLLCSVHCRHSSYQKRLHWIMQSRTAGAADRAVHECACVPEWGREERFGERLTGVIPGVCKAWAVGADLCNPWVCSATPVQIGSSVPLCRLSCFKKITLVDHLRGEIQLWGLVNSWTRFSCCAHLEAES